MTFRRRVLLGTIVAWLVGCSDLLGVQALSGAVDAGASGADARTGTDSASGVDAESGSRPPGLEAATPTDSGCQATWADASGGAVPLGAVPNSDVDSAVVVYVCRVAVPSLGQIPGKLLPGWGCYYSDGQMEQLSQGYQALVPEDCSLAWAPAVSGVAPAYALVCGEDLEGGVLYSCRTGATADYEGELGHMGWITNHDCVYSYGGASFSTTDFDVLTAQ